jgi:hypothetical protein
MPARIDFTEKQIDRMVELFNQKINLRRIGDEFGVSLPVIRKQLLLRGCVIKQRRYEITKDYFKVVDSEEKAYWLGFLAADGCIRRRVMSDSGKTRGDSIVFNLSVQDVDHLIKFKESICPDAKIVYNRSHTISKKGTKSHSDMCTLRVYSNDLIQDIMKLGVGPRKTHTIGKPNINEKYFRDYIRGFFDGDGCCYVREYNPKRGGGVVKINFSLACVSPLLRDFIAEELNKVGIDTSCTDNINLCVVGGMKVSRKFFDYLYNGATVYLERKYEKGLKFVEYFDNLPKEIIIDGYKYIPPTNGRNIGWWTEDELRILIDTNDKIPFSYLSGTYLPNKSESQIQKMRTKLGLKARRKVPGFLNIRKELKGF